MLLILKYLTIYKHYVNILSLLKLHRLISESVMLFKHLIPGCLLLLLQSQSIFPSNRIFSHQSVLCIIWPKYCCFSFSIRPSNECSGLISFRINWFDLLAVKELSRVFSNITVQKHQFFDTQLFPTLTSICDYWKNHSFN